MVIGQPITMTTLVLYTFALRCGATGGYVRQFKTHPLVVFSTHIGMITAYINGADIDPRRLYCIRPCHVYLTHWFD